MSEENLPEPREPTLTDLVDLCRELNDVVTVDLMPSACGVDYHKAKDRVMIREHSGVSIPYANAELLLETKRTWR